MILVLLWFLLLEKLVTAQSGDSYDLKPPDIDHDYRFAWDVGADQPQLHYVPVYMPPAYLNSYQGLTPPLHNVHLSPPPSKDRPERKEFLGIPFLPGPEALMAASGAAVMQKAISASVPHVPSVISSLLNLNNLFGFKNRRIPFMRSRSGKEMNLYRMPVRVVPKIPISSKYIESGEVHMSDRSENVTEPVKFVNSDFVGIPSPMNWKLPHLRTKFKQTDREQQGNESKMVIIAEDLDEEVKKEQQSEVEEVKKPKRLRKLRRRIPKAEAGGSAHTIGTVQEHDPYSTFNQSHSIEPQFAPQVQSYSSPIETMPPQKPQSTMTMHYPSHSMYEGNLGYQMSIPEDGVALSNNIVSTSLYPTPAISPVQWVQENQKQQKHFSHPINSGYSFDNDWRNNHQQHWHPPQTNPMSTDIRPLNLRTFEAEEKPFIPSPQIDESWVPETIKMMTTIRPSAFVEEVEDTKSEESESNESINQSPELLTDEVRLNKSAQEEDDKEKSYWRYLQWKSKLHKNATNDSLETMTGSDSLNSESQRLNYPYQYSIPMKNSDRLPPTPLKLIQQIQATAPSLKTSKGLGDYVTPSKEPSPKLKVTRTSRPVKLVLVPANSRDPKSYPSNVIRSSTSKPKYIIDLNGKKYPIAPTKSKTVEYVKHNLPLVSPKNPLHESNGDISSGYEFPDNHQLPTQTIYYNNHLEDNSELEQKNNHQFVKQVVTFRQQPKPTSKAGPTRNKPPNFRYPTKTQHVKSNLNLPREVVQYLKEINQPPQNHLNNFIDSQALDQPSYIEASQKNIFNDLQQHLRPQSQRPFRPPSSSQITVNALPIQFNSPYDPPKMMIQDDKLAGLVNVGGQIQAVKLMKEINPFNYRQMLNLDEADGNKYLRQMQQFKMEDILSQQKTMGYPKNFVMDSVKKGKPFKLMKIRVGR